ncbi:hypothetical protein RND71_043673 [Anisodus tanguticus]|uniref:Uncharacterized protein n=1 Tax=Anisodus tanguticus TaxID=243964 RepID=A0AAE1UTK4_9SOLA|nr:hypothetical protein RND71_043673 [Anisodus tanguticus]
MSENENKFNTGSILMKNLLNVDPNSLFYNNLLNGQNLLTSPLIANGLLNDTNSLMGVNLFNSLNNNLPNDNSNNQQLNSSESFLQSWFLQNQARQLLSGNTSDLTNDLINQPNQIHNSVKQINPSLEWEAYLLEKIEKHRKKANILELAKSSIDVNTATIYIGLVQVFFTMFACLLVDKMGRKILLYISGTLMGIAMMILSLYTCSSPRYFLKLTSFVTLKKRINTKGLSSLKADLIQFTHKCKQPVVMEHSWFSTISTNIRHSITSTAIAHLLR